MKKSTLRFPFITSGLMCCFKQAFRNGYILWVLAVYVSSVDIIALAAKKLFILMVL